MRMPHPLPTWAGPRVSPYITFALPVTQPARFQAWFLSQAELTQGVEAVFDKRSGTLDSIRVHTSSGITGALSHALQFQPWVGQHAVSN